MYDSNKWRNARGMVAMMCILPMLVGGIISLFSWLFS
jgi:hypothetical protein